MKHSRSFLERNLARFAGALQETIFAEELASRRGWLQGVDPRVKTAGFLLLIVSSSFSRSIIVVAAIYLLALLFAAGSHIFTLGFIRRVWIFMPLYTAIITLPALFLTPGRPIWTLASTGISITEQGARTSAFLVLRVATSVSFMLLLILTTPWPALLKALRALGVPRIIVFLIALTYRYIYVLLTAANALFLARKSRSVGAGTWQSNVQWIGSLLAALISKSYSLGQEVFLAMQSRGYRGEPVLREDFRMRKTDTAWLAVFVTVSIASFYIGYWKHS